MCNKLQINTTQSKSPSDGFTLIEAIIVVLLLGVISAVAIPVYRNYVKSSKQKAADVAIEQFAVHLESYRAENGQFPAANTYVYTENNDGTVNTNTISNQLPGFTPRSVSASATSFHYRLITRNVGTVDENADFKAIGVDNNFVKYSTFNALGSYR